MQTGKAVCSREPSSLRRLVLSVSALQTALPPPETLTVRRIRRMTNCGFPALLLKNVQLLNLFYEGVH